VSILENGVDTIIYAGEISRDGYEKITNVCEEAGNSSKKANLVLYTYGGDPHAAFRIARALQHHYTDGIRLFIPHYCKSAGTLIAIGASELIISDMGELGPLDVQLVKPTEMFERSSGMDITQGIEALRSQAIETFKNFVYEVRLGSKLSTKIATKVATNMTTGLFSSIFAQIDPSRLGEIQRATYIALHYGKILAEKSQNIEDNGIEKLVLGYPSHSFVIDRKEARTIFKKVNCPDSKEVELLKQIDKLMRSMLNSQTVNCFQWKPTTPQEEQSHEHSNQPDPADLSPSEGDSGGSEESHAGTKQRGKKSSESVSDISEVSNNAAMLTS